MKDFDEALAHLDMNYQYKDYRTEYTELRRLWIAVVLQALYDLRLKPKNRKARSAKNKALAWVRLDNQDFLDTCALAEFNPEKVYYKAYDPAPLEFSGVKIK
jgi:hypothetical protein